MPYLPKTKKVNKLKIADNRPNSYRRGYDSAWQIVRKEQLRHYPLCNDCLKEGRYTPANEVHHIAKLSEHPDMRDISSNLMSLCKSCHSTRTAAGE